MINKLAIAATVLVTSMVPAFAQSFGTAGSFRASGTWHFRGVATGGDVSVGS
jgi:hypothetical protein